MSVRTARTAWNGTISEGSGQVELTSSGVGTFDVTFPRRTAEEANGTSPEELIAAAHSSCYAMAFAGELADAGATPISHEITADVTLRPDPAGGLHITKVALTVRGEAEGIDAAGFRAAAEKAKAGCPVSKALTGVGEITLDVTFES